MSGYLFEDELAAAEEKWQEAVKMVQALRYRADASDLHSTDILLARLILAVESK